MRSGFAARNRPHGEFRVVPVLLSVVGAIVGGYTGCMRAWRNGRRDGLERELGALGETPGAEPLKFGETFDMAIPSQARFSAGKV